MCEAIEDDPVVYISRTAKTRLKIVAGEGAFVPFNTKNGQVQKTGFREERGKRIPVYWAFSRWLDAPH